MTCAVSAFIVVDLPAPLGPSSPTHVPNGTSRSRPSTAVTDPKRLTIPRSLIADSIRVLLYDTEFGVHLWARGSTSDADEGVQGTLSRFDGSGRRDLDVGPSRSAAGRSCVRRVFASACNLLFS